MSQARPSRTYETGAITVWMRRITVVLTIVLTVLFLVRFPTLPETIPTHFSLTGEADGWGPRWMLFTLVVPLAALVLGMVWISARPQTFNYPLVVTDMNAQAVYREGERIVVWITLSVLLLYVGIAIATFGWNGSPLVGGGALGVLVSLGVGIIRLVTAGRTSAEEPDAPRQIPASD
ncbi:DUF1648 domain-containing protein [Microbacterium sp. PF5]|uniref:DUF1648 domain-containing protein n=1 Tax=Microbacterium sp. PF5 TaxID=2305435 RepID=UPI00109BD280|nr:DUF1648 domain-containing protein [Microbacterium sp. PF5]